MRRVSFALTTLDAQMLPPIPGLDDSVSPPWLIGRLEQVAVVRLFGVTLQGASVCAHVHGFKPFFYAEVDETVAKSMPTHEQDGHLAALAELIQSRVSRSGRTKARVIGLSVEWRRSLYGFNLRNASFLRVEMADWHDIEVAAAVLQRGEVPGLGCAQAHDAHLPFLLHFLAQHHISGAGHVRLSGVFRERSSSGPSRQTSCRIELDVSTPEGIFNCSEYSNLLQSTGGTYDDLARAALRAMLDSPDARKPAKQIVSDAVNNKRPSPGERTSLGTRQHIRDWLLGGPPVMDIAASNKHLEVRPDGEAHSKMCDIEDLELLEPKSSRSATQPNLQQAAAGAFYSNLADDPKAPEHLIHHRPKCAHPTITEPHLKNWTASSTTSDAVKTPLCPSKHDSSSGDSRKDWEDIAALLSIEILCESSKTSGDAWDPTSDKIAAVAYCLRPHGCALGGQLLQGRVRTGAIIVSSETGSFALDLAAANIFGDIYVVQSEDLILQKLAELVQSFDPDVCLGWEVRSRSWGFLLQRAHVLGRHDLRRALSRTPDDRSVRLPPRRTVHTELDEKKVAEKSRHQGGRGADPQNYDSEMIAPSELQLPGRLLLNVWRVLMHITFGAKLRSYQPQEVAREILGETFPLLRAMQLSTLWQSGDIGARLAVLRHMQCLAHLSLKVLDTLEVLPRAGELSRLFGMDVMSGFTRGTQLRVESLLMRVAHAAKYSLLSASQVQVRQQPALECLPLVMEPLSGFHWDPVLVLDFKGMYPSLIIANNISFDTCLGRARRTGSGPTCTLGVRCKPWELDKDGAAVLAGEFNDGVLENANVDSPVRLLPSGCLFVAPEVRRGILPLMLTEVTRLRGEAKVAMKTASGALARRLDQRQFALKYFANVTYGYAGASFSGRMPCAEIADTIVACGRRALEEAADFIESSETGAKVIYGDTDSLFVRLQGRSLEEAFEIGRSLCTKISSQHSLPVELEFEKVYFPCLCLSKKCYAGLAYTKPPSEGGLPVFEAKGIEAVRRDQCRLASKVQRELLEIIFHSKDVSMVKQRFLQHVSQLLHGTIAEPSLTDLVFSRESRLGTYRAEDEDGNGAALPPQAAVASRQIIADDASTVPEFGDRVAYVVCCAPSGTRLADRCMTPLELLEDRGTTMYVDRWWYVEKALLPAVARVFHNDLCGLPRVDVASWIREVARPCTLESKGPLKNLLKRLCRRCHSSPAAGNFSVCTTCATKEDLEAVNNRFKEMRITAERARTSCTSCAGHALWKFCSAAAYCPVLSQRVESGQALKDVETEARILGVDLDAPEVVCISDSELSDTEVPKRESVHNSDQHPVQQVKEELLDDRTHRQCDSDICMLDLEDISIRSQVQTSSTKVSESDEARLNAGIETISQASASSGERVAIVASDSPATIPLCPGHREPCKKVEVKKEGPNIGRFFYACGRPMGEQCKFFAWVDQPRKLDNTVEQQGRSTSSVADSSRVPSPTTPRRKRQKESTHDKPTPRKRGRLTSKDGRLEPYIAKPNRRIKERIERALEHRLLLVSANHGSKGTLACTVMGHTGNVYDVSLGARVQCSCPDFAKTSQTCKHLVFVLLRVLKLPEDDPRVWQRALLPREMRDLRDRLDHHLQSPLTGVQAPSEVVSALDAVGRVMRQQLGSPCPICLDVVTQLAGSTYCPMCGRNIHVDCLEQLRSANPSQPISCSSCRRPWPGVAEITCKMAQRVFPGDPLPWRINLASESQLHANAPTLQETYPSTHQWITARNAETTSIAGSSEAIADRLLEPGDVPVQI